MRNGRGGAGRARDQAARLGTEVRVARATLRLSRDVAARRAGVSRSTFERVEAGAPATGIDILAAVTNAVRLDLVLRTYPQRGAALRDSGQMEIASWLADAASPAWRAELEVSAGDHGEAFDVVFWGTDEIIAVEIERRMVDYQAQYRSATRKRDWLGQHHGRRVRLVFAVEDTRRNRATMAPHYQLVDTVLPAGSRAVMRAIKAGAPLGSDGIVWVRRGSSDGRRHPEVTPEAG